MQKLKPYLIIATCIFAMSGCASIAGQSASLDSSQTAQKSVGSVCATTGAALQSLVVAGAISVLEKVKPEATALYPVCHAKTPETAITAAQAKAYQAIINAAAPYLGD